MVKHSMPFLHLQDRRRGFWQDRLAGPVTLEEMRAQLAQIEAYRRRDPLRIIDDAGEVLFVNKPGTKVRCPIDTLEDRLRLLAVEEESRTISREEVLRQVEASRALRAAQPANT